MPSDNERAATRPPVVGIVSGEITLRGLRVRRGTHTWAQDAELLIPWTRMRVFSDRKGPSVEIVDDDGELIARWYVERPRLRIARGVIRRAYRNAMRRGDLSVVDPGLSKIEIAAFCIGIGVTMVVLTLTAAHHRGGGLANAAAHSLTQWLQFVGGAALVLSPLLVMLAFVAPLQLRTNVAKWRVSMDKGIEAELRLGRTERRAWAEIRRVRCRGPYVTVEFIDGLVLRTCARRGAYIFQEWCDAHVPGRRPLPGWVPMAIVIAVMVVSLMIGIAAPAYLQTGSLQAIPARVWLIPLGPVLMLLIGFLLLRTMNRYDERRDRAARTKERAERRAAAQECGNAG